VSEPPRVRPGDIAGAGALLVVLGIAVAVGGVLELAGEWDLDFPLGAVVEDLGVIQGVVMVVVGAASVAVGTQVLRLHPSAGTWGTVMGWIHALLGLVALLAAVVDGFTGGIFRVLAALVYGALGLFVVSRLRRQAAAFRPESAAGPSVTVPLTGADGRPRGEPLVRLEGVRKWFPITRGIIFQRTIGHVHAVDGIDLEVYPGETLGLVGETGCGKSTAARLITKLLDVTEGRVWFDGQDITGLSRRQVRPLRREMQMIFQDPYASLNPRKSVGAIIGEPYRIHRTVSDSKIKGEVQQLMELVGLNPEHYNRFPHEFSGGQRQRVGVARALALRPRLIVCDEPVSALDVSIQAQILNLLEDLQEEFNLTYVFIAHDLSVVKHMSDRVAVMYLGRIVEMAPGDTLYRNPKHPYTGALLSAVPVADPDLAAAKHRIVLEGDVPSPIDPPSGCRFHPRCPRAQFPKCKEDDPALTPHHPGQVAACHFPLEDQAVIESSA
jgi:oligopeptide/dipeptide ABC transporter ATP-binding protein